ncbi:vWA domain-containing protein, partial [Sedimentibacter sp.]|uniref:vWA domain-containing protein n=1 Tax=Sedimentibacter sp. TaxID=1960295 RepID=UPI0028A6BF39
MNKTNMLKKILCFTIALLMLMPAMPGNLAMAVENPTVPGNIKIGGPVEPYNPDDYPIFPNQGYVRMEKYAEWIEKSEGTAKITFEITGQPVQQGVDAVLVIDRSGSMDDRTGGIGSPKRMDIAKESATNFVNTMLTPVDGSTSSENRVAVVSFAGGDYWETFFGIPIRYIPRDFTIESGVSEEKDALLGKINALRGNGNTGTNYEAAFEGAKAVLDARDDKTRPAYIIFLTDGEPNIGSDNPSDATLLKNAGVTIYAVSFQAGNNAYNIIKDVATSPSYAYNIANANDLSDLFTTLANNTKIAGTEAKLKDIIHSDYFDIDTTVLPNVIATAGIANVTGNIVDWDIENITANGAKLEIFIKLKPNLMGEEENSYPTNYSASLIYKNFNNVSCEQIVDSPELTIGAGKITIQYYLVNKDGEPINENRDVIPFDNFVPLGSEEYKITVGEGETTLLPSGTYNPISPATLPDNYVYVEASKEHGGNTSGADVVIDISSENQNDYIKTVYFGYCKGYTVTFVDHDGTILDTQTVVH